jgi:dihydrodipicolinate synthase/N-acetylneuraminate lyase
MRAGGTSMSKRNWQGSFALPMTPFDEHDRIDEDAYRAELRFCIESGVGGISTPLMVGEFFVLSEAERKLMVRLAVEECRGTGVPVVGNCAAVNTPLAVEYARYCEAVGADAVIAMPPYIQKPDFDLIHAYYKAINDAVTIPIWIQNAGVAALSADQIVRLCTEIERVSWVKEEVPPSTHSISNLMAKNCAAIEGIMGGGGGRYLLTERARGAKGCMHACQFCDIIQRIWNLLNEGLHKEGENLFDVVMPGLNLEGLMGMAFAKEVMVRRGVLKNNRVRANSKPLDAEDMREIDRVYARMEPYFTWHK